MEETQATNPVQKTIHPEVGKFLKELASYGQCEMKIGKYLFIFTCDAYELPVEDKSNV